MDDIYNVDIHDVFAIFGEHCGNWYGMEKEAAAKGDYNLAQSYKDMAYAVRAMKLEIENRLIYGDRRNES